MVNFSVYREITHPSTCICDFKEENSLPEYLNTCKHATSGSGLCSPYQYVAPSEDVGIFLADATKNTSKSMDLCSFKSSQL